MSKYGEPWGVDGLYVHDMNKDSIKIESAWKEDYVANNFSEEGESNAERIVECVNALEGYSPGKVRELLEELCDPTKDLESQKNLNSDYWMGIKKERSIWTNKARKCREENS